MAMESEQKNGINVESGQKPLNKKNSINTFIKRDHSKFLTNAYNREGKNINNPGVVEQQQENGIQI